MERTFRCVEAEVTFYHRLLKPLEKHLKRPLLIAMGVGFYLDTHYTVEGLEEFWSQVKIQMFDKFCQVTQKWRGKGPSLEICPAFRDPATLICWAYELFLGAELNESCVSLALRVDPVIPMTWRLRMKRWNKEVAE